MEKTTITQIHGISPEEFATNLVTAIKQEIERLNQSKETCNQENLTYLTRTETATLLKVSKVTLNNWAKKGILIPIRIGNLVRYDKSHVEKVLRTSLSSNQCYQIQKVNK